MHDAIEENMRVDAECRAGDNLNEFEFFPGKDIR